MQTRKRGGEVLVVRDFPGIEIYGFLHFLNTLICITHAQVCGAKPPPTLRELRVLVHSALECILRCQHVPLPPSFAASCIKSLRFGASGRLRRGNISATKRNKCILVINNRFYELAIGCEL